MKVGNGPLQKAWFSEQSFDHTKPHLQNRITIYAKEYTRFTADIHKVFTVENDSDSMTDYFEKDRIRVNPDHPLYKEVKAAMLLQQEKNKARHEKKFKPRTRIILTEPDQLKTLTIK